MPEKQLLAGAAATVITPNLGVSLCGAMTDRLADEIHDELHARSLVLDNGESKIALVVLDLIAAAKDWLADIKHQVHSYTGIPLSNILISCTDTHSGPTTVPMFQSNVERDYLHWAGPRVADSVRLAVRRLEPARIGWATTREDRLLFNRRYFMKPGTVLPAPFPGEQERVKMNPEPGDPAIDRPAGPTDAEIGILWLQRVSGRFAGEPLAIYATYAMHYVDGMSPTAISADYSGMVAETLRQGVQRISAAAEPPFVGMLANGCFGDVNAVDVRQTRTAAPYGRMREVASKLASTILAASKEIQWREWVPLDVREKTMELGVRKPTPKEVEQAKEALVRAPQGPLRTLPEVYARETVQLATWPDRFQTTLQAMRIGNLAICALPGEPFCQLGLDIKARSPFTPTFIIGAANDYAGYIPTENQFALGGYETWRAKSSFLEVNAAARIEEAAVELLSSLPGR
jgi:hypothetical protein